MEYDFSKIELLPEHVRLLKRLNHMNQMEIGKQNIEDLFDSGLICPSKRCRENHNIREIQLTDKGKLYLQWRREDRFRHHWPVYLSIVSIIISIAALITSFWASDVRTTETIHPQYGQEQTSNDTGSH